MSLLQHIKRSGIYQRVFGYDLFISYSRKDGLDYAYKIAEHFIARGYECYIDQLSNITPGAELPKNIYQAIDRCRALVIIGSPGTQNSYPVSEEIKTFLHQKKNRSLIPINISGAIYDAIWYKQIKGLALINDSLDNLNAKKPAEEVLTRIQNSLTFTRKSKKLRRTALFILTLILVAAVFAVWQSTVAVRANKLAIQARQNQAEAEKLTAQAEAEKKAADSLKSLAIAEKLRVDKIAKSSYLIAEGNKLSESDISKALIYYAYAYEVDSNLNTYKLIDSFYRKNIATIESKNFDGKRQLNHFYSRMGLKNGDVCIPENTFYRVSGSKLTIEKLGTGEQYSINLKYPFSGYIGKPHSSKLIFYNLTKNPVLWSYDMHTRRTEEILYSKLLHNNEKLEQAFFKNEGIDYFFTASTRDKKNRDLGISSSDNNRFLLLHKKDETPADTFEVLRIDLKLKQTTVLKLKVPGSKIFMDGWFRAGETGINDKGSLFYVSTSPSNHRFLLYSADSSFFLGSLYEGNSSQERNNEPTVVKIVEDTDSSHVYFGEDFLLFGTRGGLITDVAMAYNRKELDIAGTDDFLAVASSPARNISEITAIEITNDFIILGTENGVIHFFDNGLFWPEDIDMLIVETYKNISSLQLGSTSKIVSLAFDKKRNVLYAKNDEGELFKLNLYQRIDISPNTKNLLAQLKISGINDLSILEKERFRIEN